jgi:hypothetical protein
MQHPQLFFAHLFGLGIEPGYRPVQLPKLQIVAVDESPGGPDGGFIINTIQLNHANGSVVQTNDICTIERHLGLQVTRNASFRRRGIAVEMLARKMPLRVYEFEGSCLVLF